MDAIVIQPGTAGVRMVERPTPQIDVPDQAKLRVIHVGICGTDREQAAGGYARAPQGCRELVIGHEVVGQVTAVGPQVRSLRVGDYAVATVRRGCTDCQPCASGRPDMCASGAYRSRGISGLDGFQSECFVEHERHLVQVPDGLARLGVLVEPLSVAEKALADATMVAAARLPHVTEAQRWLAGSRCLVVGLGPVGLLAAMLLQLRGAQVYGLDILAAESRRVAWFTALGGIYVGGPHTTLSQLPERNGAFDLAIEAVGHGALGVDLLGALGRNGIGVLLGLPGEGHVTPIRLDLLRAMVLRNQTLLGSVNAARIHFEQAIDDLQAARQRWGSQIDQLITHRYQAGEFRAALRGQGVEEIKAVIEWSR